MDFMARGSLDGGDVLTLETIRQVVESGFGFWVVLQRLGEVRRHTDYSRLGVELQIDLDGI